jgi:hypothetical protein
MINFSSYRTSLIVSAVGGRTTIFRVPPWAIPITPSPMTTHLRVSVLVVNCQLLELTGSQFVRIAFTKVYIHLSGELEK